MNYFIKIDNENNIVGTFITNLLNRNGYIKITKELFSKIRLPAKVIFKKDEIVDIKNIQIIPQEDWKYDEIKICRRNLNDSNEKLIECFEYFLTKITNLRDINNLTDLFKIDDFPYNLKELLTNRKKIKDKIISLEKEVLDENNEI